MSRLLTIMISLLVTGVGCTSNTGMSKLVEENKKTEEALGLQGSEARETKNASIEVKVREAVQNKLKMPDDKVGALQVTAMPNGAYAGARDPSTGLCLLLKKADKWNVVHLSSRIDEAAARKAMESTDVTVGEMADIQSLAMWSERNCPMPE